MCEYIYPELFMRLRLIMLFGCALVATNSLQAAATRFNRFAHTFNLRIPIFRTSVIRIPVRFFTTNSSSVDSSSNFNRADFYNRFARSAVLAADLTFDGLRKATREHVFLAKCNIGDKRAAHVALARAFATAYHLLVAKEEKQNFVASLGGQELSRDQNSEPEKIVPVDPTELIDPIEPEYHPVVPHSYSNSTCYVEPEPKYQNIRI